MPAGKNSSIFIQKHFTENLSQIQVKLQDILAFVKPCLSSTKSLDDSQERSFAFICALISLISQDPKPVTSINVPEGSYHGFPTLSQPFSTAETMDERLAAFIIPKFARYVSMPLKVLADR